ncbi:MAG: GNAT family N-acetyltransferase/peptidase C39 family protein [Opitutaceae bacterium]
MSPPSPSTYCIRNVCLEDLDALVQLEETSFEVDRISRRSFLRWIKVDNSILRVLIIDNLLVGYGLALLHSGTRLARLYSLALNDSIKGKGYGRIMLQDLEEQAVLEERFFMRLEVSTKNQQAIQLYEKSGYQVFDEWHDYYEDHSAALRMQKKIRFPEQEYRATEVPWYRQTTDFTCGPACLMMAMRSIDRSLPLNQELELDLWRESTTIFMTSGHGGCHPLGLALAAQKRGFTVSTYINQTTPLFIEGVRAPHKKEILKVVHQQFVQKARTSGIETQKKSLSLNQITKHLDGGAAIIALVSSYRINGDKAPHWVVITTYDEFCIYVHDPDMDHPSRSEMDCQHIPISKKDFARMSSYGNSRVNAAIVLTR